MKARPRFYTDWKRPSRDRARRVLLLLAMAALAGLALWLFGTVPMRGDGGWP